MTTRRRLAWTLSLALIPLSAHAGSVAPSSSVDRFGVTARSLATGRVGAAVSDNPDSLVLNPAGLVFINQAGLHLFTSSLALSARYYSAAYTGQKLGGHGAFGLGYMRLDSGDIPGRTVEFDSPDSYKVTDQAAVSGLALQFGSGGPALGASFRFRQQQVDTVSGSGFGADAGVIQRFSFSDRQRINLGAVYQDAVPLKVTLDESASPKPAFRAGVAYETVIPSGPMAGKILLALDGVKRAGGGFATHAGAEYDLGLLALRGGFEDGDVAFGVGASFASGENLFRLDYGMVNRSYDPLQTFSLSWLFGRPREPIFRPQRSQERPRAAAVQPAPAAPASGNPAATVPAAGEAGAVPAPANSAAPAPQAEEPLFKRWFKGGNKSEGGYGNY